MRSDSQPHAAPTPQMAACPEPGLCVATMTTEGELESLRCEWNQLLRTSDNNCVFLTWEWMRTWWAHYSDRKKLFVLTARDASGRLVGVAPLKIAKRSYRGIPFRQLEFIGYGSEVNPEYLDIIVAPSHRDLVLRAFGEAIARAHESWDVMLLADMLDDSQSFAWVNDFARRNGYPYAEREASRCPYVELPRSWNVYVASLSASLRKTVRRSGRILARDHGAKLILLRQRADVATGLHTLFRLHAARWSSRRVVGSFDRHAQNKAFHTALADAFTQTDRLRLYFLEADGEVVAALYGYEYEGRFAYYQSGFDPRWGRHSVGSLLLAWTIEDCIARGVCEFDFLRGDETYKRRWAHSDRTTRDAVVWNDTVRGRLHLAQKRAVAAVKSLPGAAARLRYCLSSTEDGGGQ